MIFHNPHEGGAAMGKLNICKRIAERLGGNVEYKLDHTSDGYSGGCYVVDLKVVP
jgi:hypothetical protein